MENSTYFRLNVEYFLIAGKAKSSLYHISGELWSLDEDKSRFLAECESGRPVRDEARAFLTELNQQGLGRFYSTPVYVEKYHVGSPLSEGQTGMPPKFQRAFLVLNNRCDRDCWFCGERAGRISRTNGCLGCNVWNDNRPQLQVSEWKEVLQQLADLGCWGVFVSGGDLTADWPRAKELIAFARRLFPHVWVTIQARRWPAVVEDVKTLGVIPILQVMEGEAADNLDSGLDPLVLLVARAGDEKAWQRQAELANAQVQSLMDVVGQDDQDFKIGARIVEPTPSIQFLHNLKYHPCLGGALAIASNGDVLPCPMMRGQVFGNVKETPLYSIMREKFDDINHIWRLTKDKIQRCQDCEYRYTCHDCRALEVQRTQSLEGKSLCNYDPYQGIWEND